MADPGPLLWSVLIHSLPPRPAYLRAKVRNELRRAGAVALKDSVYVLPASDRSREALRKIVAEAAAGGGEAYLCEARFDDRETDSLLTGKLAQGSSLEGRVWTTRRGIQIDRIASAWLIRRFVDPRARFRFLDGKEPRRPGEVRFDMVGGDYTHEDDRCTFETLAARLKIADRGVREIAEIVHDVDLKDGKFGRPEAAGLQRMINGLVLANPGDEDRLKRGLTLFDELHRTFVPAGIGVRGPR